MYSVWQLQGGLSTTWRKFITREASKTEALLVCVSQTVLQTAISNKAHYWEKVKLPCLFLDLKKLWLGNLEIVCFQVALFVFSLHFWDLHFCNFCDFLIIRALYTSVLYRYFFSRNLKHLGCVHMHPSREMQKNDYF